MRILMIIAIFLCIGYSESYAQRYQINKFEEYDRNPSHNDTVYVKNILSYTPYQRGDSVFNEYYPYIFLNESLSNATDWLLEPCATSPFYKRDISGNFRLKPECHIDTISISDTLFMWLRFIVFESLTVNSTGFGPKVVFVANENEFTINYTQLIAANTWYKLNQSILGDYAFFLFCGSKSGYNWLKPVLQRSFDNEDVLDTELPLELSYDIDSIDRYLLDHNTFRAINIRSLFNMYDIPDDDPDTFWNFSNSFNTFSNSLRL